MIRTETTHLELTNNNIMRIGDQTFSQLPNLIYLNLGHNNIYKITPAAFDGFLNLRVRIEEKIDFFHY